MSSILCLYKYENYKEEADDASGDWWDDIPRYNSRQSRLHKVTEIGDRAYVVTYKDGCCYLVGRITISEKVPNLPSHPYGIFGIKGDPRHSQFYKFGSKDVTEVLRRLEFKTGKRIGSSMRPLSWHFRAIRELTEGDVALLESIIPGAR
jgi:hypothetical protein